MKLLEIYEVLKQVKPIGFEAPEGVLTIIESI